jgi:hypothetical protein
MPKEEREPQIEVEPENQYLIDHYQKIYKDISDEIVHLREEIDYEIQWLEQPAKRLLRSVFASGISLSW